MDPNVNLEEQLQLIKLMPVSRLAELVEAMNDWISNGGVLPDEWSTNRVVLPLSEANKLAAWADEAERSGGTTAWGPLFDDAMDAALYVRDQVREIDND